MHSLPDPRSHQREQLVGARVGSWQLDSVLGEGATAVVYKAHRLAGGSSMDAQTAAIKILHPEAAADAKIRTAFLNENRILMKLRHPSIVRAYDFGMENGRAYLAMTLVQGQTLEQMLTPKRRLGEIVAVDVTAAIARALAAMHRQQIVHRDIKPGNILVEEGSRRPILFDLGAAIDLAVDKPVAGEVFGTPAYVSPEQARGDAEIDGRADIYSLGVTLYRMLAGRKPFYGSRMEVLGAHVDEPPPSPSEFGYISPELEAVVLKAIAKAPDNRFQDADEFADAMLHARENRTEAPSAFGERLRDWIRGNSPRIT
jgi:serine/threonine-protein kinase